MATKKQDVLALLDKAVGKKGPLRIPAYWMREVLLKIMDWAEGLTPKVDVPTKISQLENDSGFVDSGFVNSLYLSKSDASSTYLSKSDASSTYLSKSDASSTYLSKSSASSTYATKTYVESAIPDVSGFATKDELSQAISSAITETLNTGV